MAGIDECAAFQCLDGLVVERAAAALVLDRAVPMKSQILKRPLNVSGAAGPHARGIEVLDAQEPATALVMRIKIAAKRGNQRSEMQRTGRGGREAADVAHAAPNP